jgi:hypothetical protein
MNNHEEFRAGTLTIALNRSTGGLRWLTYGPHEVLRGIYGAVRDRNWGTVPPRIEQLSIERGHDDFRVELVADCQRDDIDYRWHGTIVGTADSVVRYRFSGNARSTFLRNRIGLCVLHPIRECAGQPCKVLHIDGTNEQGEFPLQILGRQPFTRIAALRHHVTAEVDAEVRFEGDTFETEDQRNWTDASFKTYGTPLALPFPVEVHPGDTVEQEVIVRLVGNARTLTPTRPRVVSITIGEALKLPRVGFSHPGRYAALDDAEIARLATLRPGHIRVEVWLDEPGYMDDLKIAADDARRLDAPLQVVVILDDRPELELNRMLNGLRALSANVAECVVLDHGEVASDRVVKLFRARLSEIGMASRIGVGTIGNFAELNRNRPPAGVCDFLTYAVNPQAHAFDDATIVENLAGQAETARTANAFAGKAAVQVGPIRLKQRLPTRAKPSRCGPLTAIPDDADSRQTSTFLAGWTLGSIAALSREGAAAVTYFDLTGCGGIVGSHGQAGLPAPFGPLAAAAYPVYHVLADLAELHNSNWRALNVDVLDSVVGLLCEKPHILSALVANLTDRASRCNLPFTASRLRVLDHTTQSSAMHAPAKFRVTWRSWSSAELELPPHSYLRVEGAAS